MPHDAAAGASTKDRIETPPSANKAAIAAVEAHHAELATQLQALTAAVLDAARTDAARTDAARTDDGSAARSRLHAWYREQLMPHIVAEEIALYGPAVDLDVTRLLVCGMLAEHQALIVLVGEMALAPTDFAAATAAAAAQALFAVHLDKENDLLLPALDEAGLDLAAVLEGMHEVMATGTAAHEAHGCGCSCGHDGAGQDAPSLSATPERDGELDVRTLPHGQRHEIIFGRLQALAAGEALVIVNDHDPKPLRYQAEALWPGSFTWTYREAGPQVWRLAITRAG